MRTCTAHVTLPYGGRWRGQTALLITKGGTIGRESESERDRKREEWQRGTGASYNGGLTMGLWMTSSAPASSSISCDAGDAATFASSASAFFCTTGTSTWVRNAVMASPTTAASSVTAAAAGVPDRCGVESPAVGDDGSARGDDDDDVDSSVARIDGRTHSVRSSSHPAACTSGTSFRAAMEVMAVAATWPPLIDRGGPSSTTPGGGQRREGKGGTGTMPSTVHNVAIASTSNGNSARCSCVVCWHVECDTTLAAALGYSKLAS